MADESDPTADPQRGLRAHADARRRATVARLEEALARLAAEGRPVSAAAIASVGGPDFMTIRRNDEAYALFRRHSAHLRATRAREARTRRVTKGRGAGAVEEVPPPVRDRLLHYPKARLVTDLHAARDERDALAVQYRQLLQEHMGCGMRIATLEAKLAEYDTFLARFRDDLRGQEHGSER